MGAIKRRRRTRPRGRRSSGQEGRVDRRGPGEGRLLVDTLAQRLAHVGSWEWDPVSNVVTWSRELYRIYGLAPGEFPGTYEGFIERVHPDDRQSAQDTVAASIRESKPFVYDHRIVRSDGAVRTLHTCGDAVRGRDGAVDKLVGCCMDVTELAETRRRLDESLALLRATLDSTADGIFVIDLSGKVVTCNKRALELWALPPDLAGRGDIKAMIDHVSGQLEDPDAFLVRERRLIADQEHHGVDRIRFKDGRVFERYTQPQRLAESVVGRVCSFRDVTERERAREDLEKLAAGLAARVRERTQELESSNCDLESFAAAVSHDLSAPLRKITAYAQFLEAKAGPKLGASERVLVTGMQKCASDMARLISDVLSLSRITRDTLPAVNVDLDDALAHVLSDLEVNLAQTGGSVDAEPLPRVRGHEALWRRLLQNLIDNALKFRAPDRPPKVVVRSKAQTDGGVIIEIQDNGIGFEPQFARAIFRPFRRLHSAAKYEGSGVGLATCQRIIERYGGVIWAESAPGRGSTFFIRLPASALAKAA